MRPVPISELGAAVVAKIKSGTFTRALAAVDLDEFWALDTRLSQVSVPAVIVEYVGNSKEDFPRHGVIQQTHQFWLNYVDKVAVSGSKATPFQVGLTELEQVFSSGTEPEARLTLANSRVELKSVLATKTETSNDLRERNMTWGRILLEIELNAIE